MIVQFFDWFFDNLFFIFLVAFVLWEGKMLYKTLFLQPIRGGNGIAQMDEVAKWLMMLYLGYMVWKEGEGAEQAYPESVFWAMVVGAFLIAGVKEFAMVLGNGNLFKKTKTTEPTKKPTEDENLG